MRAGLSGKRRLTRRSGADGTAACAAAVPPCRQRRRGFDHAPIWPPQRGVGCARGCSLVGCRARAPLPVYASHAPLGGRGLTRRMLLLVSRRRWSRPRSGCRAVAAADRETADVQAPWPNGLPGDDRRVAAARAPQPGRGLLLPARHFLLATRAPAMGRGLHVLLADRAAAVVRAVRCVARPEELCRSGRARYPTALPCACGSPRSRRPGALQRGSLLRRASALPQSTRADRRSTRGP